ncbi:MAG TPA: tetratricopeptide repeat protein [Blastocatellia bacterium]|jgi:tetratricopeptide (TPR) repeat protein
MCKLCKLYFAIFFLAGVFALGSRQRAAAQSQPSNVDRIFARAVALHQAGDIEGAIHEYQTLLAVNPNRVDARSNLGAAYARLGRYQDAIEQYKSALALDERNSTIRFNLALAFYKAAYITDAAAEFSRIVGSQPENKNAVFLLADCYLQLGEHKKVIELLSPHEATYGNERALAYLLGTALIYDNQTEKGQLLIDRILRDGDSAEARLLIGTAHLMAREHQNAIKEFERAIELNPKLPAVHSLYAKAMLSSGEVERARKSFQDELEINPNDFEANLYLGLLLKQDQENEKALGYFQRALMVRPRELNVRYFIGSLYVTLGKTADAQRMLEDVVKDAPDFVEAHVSLATVYYRLKRKEDGDRERVVIQKLNAERQARAPGAQDSLGPAYRGEKFPNVKPFPKQENKQR